jgi:hypothetical protein
MLGITPSKLALHLIDAPALVVAELDFLLADPRRNTCCTSGAGLSTAFLSNP